MQAKPLTRKVKDHRGNEHEVYKWYWMKGWEFYQTEPADEFLSLIHISEPTRRS